MTEPAVAKDVPTNFRGIIDLFKEPGGSNDSGCVQLADATGRNAPQVRKWYYRGSIPSDAWVDVVEAAKVIGRPDVNYELLARLAAGQAALKVAS